MANAISIFKYLAGRQISKHRKKFWAKVRRQANGIKFILPIHCNNSSSVSVPNSPTPAPLFFSGRADNACTNLLGSLARYVRTRGIAETVESAKLPTCAISHVPHTLATHYFLRLTRARGRRFLRGWKILLNDFCRAFGHSKAREKKSFFMILCGRPMVSPTI